MNPSALLEVRNLSVSLFAKGGGIPILHGISFSLDPGKCLSIVGESGCGKTITALSVLGLLPPPGGRIDSGEILFRGQDLAKADEKTLRGVRGRRIAMIFQDAPSALNPYLRVSEQLIEALMLHKGVSEREALGRAVSLLEEMGIADARARIHDYPHKFSGGMLQRIMIASALMTSPDLIIADEPTSALDVTVQAQTLKLLDVLCETMKAAVILITHDLGVVAGRSDTTAVMYAGRIVEYGPTARVVQAPGHPYMSALLRSSPALDSSREVPLEEIPGQPPRPGTMPAGCPFAPRCGHALERCGREIPPLLPLEEEHSAACWLRG